MDRLATEKSWQGSVSFDHRWFGSSPTPNLCGHDSWFVWSLIQ